MNETNLRILLRSRPVAMPGPENFEVVEAPAPEPGEVLVRHRYLSLDAYMRGGWTRAAPTRRLSRSAG